MRDNRRDFGQTIPVTGISDTHRLMTHLTQKGFSTQQAEALIEAVQEIDLSEVATKQDVTLIKHELEKLELRLTLKLGTLTTAGIGVLALLKYFG